MSMQEILIQPENLRIINQMLFPKEKAHQRFLGSLKLGAMAGRVLTFLGLSRCEAESK